MKFSVITPSFNGMPHIRKCIGSIRGQVLPKAGTQRSEIGDRRSEKRASEICYLASENESSICVQHIVQDGGSSDETVEFLRKFDVEIRGQRTEVRDQKSEALVNARCLTPDFYSFSFSSKEDEGMYDAINRGWSRASGDILSWLNHDEQYLPGTLAKVGKVFGENPDVDFVYGNFIILTPEGLPISARREIPLRMRYLCHSNLYAASCTMFFRRNLLDAGDLVFDTNYKLAGDMELVMRLLDRGYKPFHINSYLGLFGADDGNLTVSQSDLNWQETARLWAEYGGSNNTLVCKAMKTLRWIERFFSGCYRSDDLSFDYVLDEIPNYRRVEADRVTFRFGFDKINELKELRCRT